MPTRPVLALIVFALALVACAPAAPVPTAPGQPGAPAASAGPARVGFGAPEFERPAFEPLIAAFNAANPDVQVEFVPLEDIFEGGPEGLAERLATAADTFSTLFLSAEAAAGGALADLRPLIDADPGFDRADFYPGALATAADGGLYQLAHTLSVQTLSYNGELWEAAGLPAPAAGWSWGELLAAAEQLARRDGDEVQVYGLDDGQGGALVLQGLLAEAGVSLELGPDGGASLGDPALSEALARLGELADSGAVRLPDPGTGVSFGNPFEDRQAGRVAMWLGPASFGGPEATEPAFTVGAAALPELPRQALVGQRSYAMSAGTASREAAWRWLSFLSRNQPGEAQGFVRIFGGGTEIPARRSVAEATGFWERQEPTAAAALRSALEAYDAAPASHPAVAAALAVAVQELAAGAGPDGAVSAAEGRLQELIDEWAAAAEEPRDPPVVRLPEPTAAAPAGATPLTFSGFGLDPAELRRLADAFNRESGSSYVQIAPPPSGPDGFSLEWLVERSDCFLWPQPPSPEERASLLDLQPLLDAGDPALAADYPAGLLQPYRDGERLYGLPLNVVLRSLSYNRDLFDAAGVGYPSPDWGYAELLDAATRLTDAEGPQPSYGYVATGSQAADLRAFLEWRGARLTSGSGTDARPTLTDETVRAAVGEYLELLQSASPHTSLGGYRADGAFDPSAFALTQGGRAGIWYDYSGAGLIIRIDDGQAPPDVAVAPPLAGDGGPRLGTPAGQGMFISAQSANPAGCWEWLAFLSEQTGIHGESFPARRSVAESQAYLAGARPGAAEVYAAYAEALEAPVGADPLAALDLFWLYQAVDRALQGGDLDRELERAQLLTEQYADCVAAGGEPGECATATDPEYAGLGPGR